LVLSAVGRHRAGGLALFDQVVAGEPLGQFARLGVPQPDPVPDPQRARRLPQHRRLHLTRALGPGEPQPGRHERGGLALGGVRPGGDVTAGEQGDRPAARPPYHRQRVDQRGARREAAVGVEQGGPHQAGSGRQLGHGRVGGGHLEAAGPAAVDELQRGQVPDPADRLAPPLAQFGR
jgi:hypothetical protein